MNTRTLIFWIITSPLAWALLEPAPPQIAESQSFRESLLKTDKLVIYEGLPHQTWQADKLKEELKRSDVTKIGGYPFYTPALEVTNSDELKQLLGAPASIQPYLGPKGCGGYHPDYSVSWTAEGITYHVQICLGCHEVVFLTGNTSLKYDMADDAVKRFEALRKLYTLKRPE